MLINLIGVLFLVITLVVGTKVIDDKNISLNINEQAKKLEKTGNSAFDKCREESGREVCNERLGTNINWKGENVVDTSNVDKNADPKSPTCDSNGTQYSEGAKVIGGSSGYSKCEGGRWTDCPECTITSLTTVPVYKQEEYNLAKEAEKQATQQPIVEQQPVEDYVAGPVQLEPVQPTQQPTVATVTNPISPFQNITTGAGGGTIPSIVKTQPKYASKSDCLQNASPGSRDYFSCGQYTTAEESKPALLESLKGLGADFSNRWSSSFGDGSLFDNAQLSLGSENTSIVAPPSILLSKNPQDLKDFYKGVRYAGGAGTVIAGTVLTGGTLIPYVANVGLPVAGLMAMNTIAAATHTISALTVGGLTIGAVDCAINGGNSKLCKTAGDMAIIGYTGAPAEFTQMFNQGVKVYTDTASVLSNIKKIPAIQTQTTPELGNGDDVIDMVWNNVTQKFVMEGNTVSKAIVQQQSALTNIENEINTLNKPSQMLFAPTTQNFLRQVTPNIDDLLNAMAPYAPIGNPFGTLDTADNIVANLPKDFQAEPNVIDVTGNIPPATEITIPQKITNWVKAEMAKTNPNAFKNIGQDITTNLKQSSFLTKVQTGIKDSFNTVIDYPQYLTDRSEILKRLSENLTPEDYRNNKPFIEELIKAGERSQVTAPNEIEIIINSLDQHPENSQVILTYLPRLKKTGLVAFGADYRGNIFTPDLLDRSSADLTKILDSYINTATTLSSIKDIPHFNDIVLSVSGHPENAQVVLTHIPKLKEVNLINTRTYLFGPELLNRTPQDLTKILDSYVETATTLAPLKDISGFDDIVIKVSGHPENAQVLLTYFPKLKEANLSSNIFQAYGLGQPSAILVKSLDTNIEVAKVLSPLQDFPDFESIVLSVSMHPENGPIILNYLPKLTNVNLDDIFFFDPYITSIQPTDLVKFLDDNIETATLLAPLKGESYFSELVKNVSTLSQNYKDKYLTVLPTWLKDQSTNYRDVIYFLESINNASIDLGPKLIDVYVPTLLKNGGNIKSVTQFANMLQDKPDPTGIAQILDLIPVKQWVPFLKRYDIYNSQISIPDRFDLIAATSGNDQRIAVNNFVTELQRIDADYNSTIVQLLDGVNPTSVDKYAYIDNYLKSIDENYAKSYADLAEKFGITDWKNKTHAQVLAEISPQIPTVPLKPAKVTFNFRTQDTLYSAPENLMSTLRTGLEPTQGATSEDISTAIKTISDQYSKISDTTLNELINNGVNSTEKNQLLSIIPEANRATAGAKIEGILKSNLPQDMKLQNIRNVVLASMQTVDNEVSLVIRELFIKTDAQMLLDGFVKGTLSPEDTSIFLNHLSELQTNALPDLIQEYPGLSGFDKTLESTDLWKNIKQINAQKVVAEQVAKSNVKEITLSLTNKNLIDVWQGNVSGTCFGNCPAFLSQRSNIVPVKMLKDGDIFGNALFIIQPDKFILIGFDPSVSFASAVTKDKMNEFVDLSMQGLQKIADENGLKLMIGIPGEVGGLSNRANVEDYITKKYLNGSKKVPIQPESTLQPVYGYEPKNAYQLDPKVTSDLRNPVPTTLSQPKTTIFGYEFNGFRNEEGKFTLWPFEKTTVPVSGTLTTVTPEVKLDTNLGYEDITKSPLFENGYLNVKGTAMPPEKVTAMIQTLCKRLPTACKNSLLSPTYHGSSSPSLYGLLQGDATPIRPLSDLTKSGEPVFTEAKLHGLLDTGTSSDTGGTGIVSVSVISPVTALEYSRPISFSLTNAEESLSILKTEFDTFHTDTLKTIDDLNIPAREKQSISDYFKSTLTYNQPLIDKNAKTINDILNRYKNSPELPTVRSAVLESSRGLYYRNNTLRSIDLIEQQLASYPKLELWKKDLLDNSFPVVYGIKPESGHQSIFMSGSDVDLDMGFGGGFKLSEIENVFIPKSEIPRIEKLWSELHPNIPIPFKLADIDALNPNAKVNLPANSGPSLFGFEFNGFKDWWNGEMAKTNPNAFKNIGQDITNTFDNVKNGFELRSPISTDGKLQLPFEKVTVPVSEVPVEPEANRIPIVSKEEQITNLTNPSYSVDQSSPFITIQETAPTAVEPLNKSSFFLNSTEPKIAGWEGQTDQALQRTIASKGYQEATSGIKMPDQLQTYAAPTAGRTDFIILDQPIEDSLGNRFPTLQRKGVGTVREILADQDSSKLFGAPSLKDPAIYPILGSTYQYGYDLDVKASTLWASKGLRVRMPYGEYKLITVFDGGKAVNLTINSDNPQIISIWATRNPLTLEDFNKVNLMAYNTSKLPELVSDTLKNQAYFLQFETDPIAQSLSKSLLTDPKTHSKEWIDWLASTYGAQTGIKTGEGLFSGEMHRQNLSLTPEFRDLGDNPDNPNLEKYKTSPIPFIQITDPEYKSGMIQEVFYVLGGVLNTEGIINVAYGHNVYTNDLAQNLTSTATKFFKGFAASDYPAYRAFLESVGSGQEFYLHEFVRAYEISVDAYGFSNLGTNYGINIYDIIRGVIKQQLLENGITTVTSSSLLTQIDVENYHRVQSVEPVENAIAQAAPPYQPATTTSERPSILTQVQDWWKTNIADEQGFLPPVRRFLNPVPTQKLTTDEITNLINNTNGPIIEVGGPTPGYKQVYIPELNRNIYISNIETGTPVIENGVQIGSTVNGRVDLLTDSTKLPFADNSVGAIFGSALEEQTIPQTLSEAYRTLKPDGVLVLQNAKSIENQTYAGIIAEAEKLGFKPLSNIEIYRFPGKSDNVLRDLVFQKTENITQTAVTTAERPSLLGFGWNGFRNTEGQFQFPVGRVPSVLEIPATQVVSNLPDIPESTAKFIDTPWQSIRRTESEIIADNAKFPGEVIDLPQSSPENGLSTAILFNKPIEGNITVYRSINNPNLIFDQTSSIIRVDPNNLALNESVKNFANKPSLETFNAMKIKMIDPQQIKDLKLYEESINDWLKAGTSYEEAVIRVHTAMLSGIDNPGSLSPYLSASTNITEATSYLSKQHNGGILVLSIPKDRIIDFNKFFGAPQTEVAIKEIINPNEIVAFIPTKRPDFIPNNQTLTDESIKEAANYVNKLLVGKTTTTQNPPLTGVAKFQEQVGSFWNEKVTNGSVPTGVGFSPLKYVAGGIVSAAFLDDYFDLGITDPVYDTVNFWINNASIIYALNNDKELSEISIANPNQRPYDEVIEEAINNYTSNNPNSDVYYSPNPQALSLVDIFKQLFSRDSFDIISSTLVSENYEKLKFSGKIMRLSNNLLTDRNSFIGSVIGAAGNIGLYTKDGGTYPINGFDNEVKSLVVLIEEEFQATGRPVSHSFVIEYFLQKNNGDLAQSILDSSNFEEFLLRSSEYEIVGEPYVWIQNHILDEYSPLLPYQRLPDQEDKLENSTIYYDYSLPNRLGEIYHAASITALLNYLPPELIRAMVFSEYLSYGDKHGLIKMSADLEVLKQLDNINDLLNSYNNIQTNPGAQKPADSQQQATIPKVNPAIQSSQDTSEQQRLELERQEKIKSGLYAQIDADLATQTILGGAGKPFKNIGCGQVAVANILCEYGNYCPTPLQIAEQIPLQEYAESGLTSTQSNIKILNENGFTTDPYTKSLQYHLTEYMEPTDVLWISGIVGGIDHHTYINGYTLDKNGIAIYNLNDSYFGNGYKCKTSGDSSFSCDNPDGSHINIGAENANIYIIDTNI